MEQTQQTKQQQFAIVKAAYIKILNDKDVMLNWGRPNLEALYISKIGYLQINKLQIELRIKALKRKIEMVVASINKQEPVDLINIELQIALELAKAEQDILVASSDLENANYLLTHLASPTHSNELKELYKQLAKQLHPDVNPNLTDQQRNLWHIVQDAYKSGDLEKLRSIPIVYEDILTDIDNTFHQLSDEELSIKIKVLTEGIKVLEAEILEINKQFPFNMKEQILDDEWISSEKESIQSELNQLTMYEQDLTQQFTHLVNSL
jgi:hypothetical protein